MSAENKPQNEYAITRPKIFAACKNCPLFNQAASESPKKPPTNDIWDIGTLDEHNNPINVSVRPTTMVSRPIAVSCRLITRLLQKTVIMTESHELVITEGQIYNPFTLQYKDTVTNLFPQGLLIPETFMTQTKLSSKKCPGLAAK